MFLLCTAIGCPLCSNIVCLEIILTRKAVFVDSLLILSFDKWAFLIKSNYTPTHEQPTFLDVTTRYAVSFLFSSTDTLYYIGTLAYDIAVMHQKNRPEQKCFVKNTTNYKYYLINRY